MEPRLVCRLMINVVWSAIRQRYVSAGHGRGVPADVWDRYSAAQRVLESARAELEAWLD